MVVAEFKKVSKEQFQKDLKQLNNISDDIYEDIIMPKRATKASAGYDFYSPINITLLPNETIKIPTGIRVKMLDNYVLQIYPRSSLGFKYQMALLNTVGIIDADYYNADNEGHIIAAIVNRGDKPLTINKGDRFIQGIFVEYHLAYELEVLTERKGGFGSTN